jgi:uncharacterized membrane protein
MNKLHTINLNLPLYMACWVIVMVTSFIAVLSVPAGTELPIHWNIHFEPDNYANRWIALLMLPMVSLGVALLMKVVPMIEPRSSNLQKSMTAYQGVFWAVQVFFFIFQLFIISFAWDWGWDMATFVSVALALLFLVLGNFLGKTRSTYLFGIRTPWTLHSEMIWRKTHRSAGFGLFGVGLFMVLMTPWANQWTLVIGISLMFMVFIGATVYSYLLWRSQTEAVNKDA